MADSASNAPLALAAVIASGLPDTLGSPDEPQRYDVPAVFNRRPESAEVVALSGEAARIALSEAGYPGVTLGAEDRRLHIRNTNLAELAEGLATEVATVVDDLSRAFLAERAKERGLAEREANAQEAEAHETAQLASKIHFDPRPIS
jgi:hypothetical protein